MAKYIYQYKNWPNLVWDEKKIQSVLGKVRYLQGKIFGQTEALGFSVKQERMLETLTQNVIKSSEIEGEVLNYEQVRSSIAKKLGLNVGGIIYVNRNVEGIVEMMLDATQNYKSPLTEERLFAWHASLFPTGWSGMYKIDAGKYRKGEMQIVSGAMGKEKIHYEAPPPARVKQEMDMFLEWLNSDTKNDYVVKSAVAHFWFVIIHPFDDGNGRIARAISDLLLARSDDSPLRFYSLSSQILKERKDYYQILQKVQYNQCDITEWVLWYLNCLLRALKNSEEAIKEVIFKAKFWDKHKNTELNARQRLMLNKLLDGFSGKLKTSKWAKISKCSQDTALRDIKDLIDKGILKPEKSGGRSTSYELIREL